MRDSGRGGLLLPRGWTCTIYSLPVFPAHSDQIKTSTNYRLGRASQTIVATKFLDADAENS